ncbi:MAG: tetratricopeptide repeat protein [Bacteroidetes bacterium]|nr:tetratricopeptide repeat protein [Bacteroidota bacterium]
MRKLLAISTLLLLVQHLLFAQQNALLDSAHKVLLTYKDDTAKVNTLNFISHLYRYTNTDTSGYFARSALKLATKLNYEKGIADSKVRISMNCATMGKYEEGVTAANEALIIYNKLLKTATGEEKKKLLKKKYNAYNVTAHNRLSQGDNPEGLKYSLLALKIAEELGEVKGVLYATLNVGSTYYVEKNFTESLKYSTASLALAHQLKDSVEIAGCYNSIAYVHMELNQNDTSLKYCNLALQYLEGRDEKATLAESYNVLGIVTDRKGDYQQALQYDFKALKLYEEIGNKEQIPFVYNNIANVYLNQNKFNDALLYVNKAIANAKDIGSLSYLSLSYQMRSTVDSALGNYPQAYANYKMHILFRDSVDNQESKKKIVQTQMKYDFDKREAAAKAEQAIKDAVATKELQKQKLMRNGFMGGFAIVALFAGVFFGQRNKIKKGKKLSDELLLNILPEEVAEELKAKGSADAKQFDEFTVMFTDFKGFTQISEKLTPAELVSEIHTCFKAFDNIIDKYNIEKIKTIGDAYMCAGGLPVANTTNAMDVVNAAIEIQKFMQEHLQQRKNEGKEVFEIRIGIHTGGVVAGIVGVKKFAYDIWGDTVNIASRMESSGEAGKVNISGSTYELVKDKFNCTHRGKIMAKNKGEIEMYFVSSSINEG